MQQPHQQCTAEAVVNGLGFDEAVAEGLEIRRKDRAVAHRNERLRILLRKRADVDEHFLDRRGNAALLGLLHVDGLGRDYARQPFVAEQDAFAGRHARVDAADRAEVGEPFLGNVRDHKADLVHMRGKQQLFRTALPAFFEGDEAAAAVGAQLVRIGRDVGSDHLPQLVLLPRGRKGRAVFFQKRFHIAASFFANADGKFSKNAHSSRAAFSASSMETTSAQVCI